MPSCLTLSNISYELRVKWINPGKGVVAIEKGAFGSSSTKGDNFTLLTQMNHSTRLFNHKPAQSSESVECPDCISAEG